MLPVEVPFLESFTHLIKRCDAHLIFLRSFGDHLSKSPDGVLRSFTMVIHSRVLCNEYFHAPTFGRHFRHVGLIGYFSGQERLLSRRFLYTFSETLRQLLTDRKGHQVRI
jgi:hypothetical protein